MRSKGSRFTLGVWGLRVCSLDGVKPFATVRNRSREACMAVPMVISANGSLLVGFRCRIASFCVAGVALCDSNMFQNRVEGRFVWQAQYFCDVFRKCVLSFRGRRSTLATSIVISRGRQAHSSVGAPCVRVPVDWWCARVPMCPYARARLLCKQSRK